MNFESGIAIIWLLPVVVQIVLPLIMLLFYGGGKLFASVFELNRSVKKSDTLHGVQGKSGIPTAGAMA
jgi:hypothetical protein